jgi:predicted transcriptional regulator
MPRTKTSTDSEKTVGLGVRVSPAVKEALIAIARKERRTISQVAAFMIEESLLRRKQLHK